jgi:hypothetical protein
VLVAAKEKLLSTDTLLSPTKIVELLKILGENIKTDFSTDEAQRLIELVKQVDSSNVINLVFDNSAEGFLDSQSGAETGYILIPSLGLDNYKDIQSKVKNIFSQDGIESEALKITVENGTTRSGLALRVKENLSSLGYNVITATSADNSSYTETVIYDYTTSDNKSVTVSSLESLYGVTSEKKVSSSSDSDVVIILGSDFEE